MIDPDDHQGWPDQAGTVTSTAMCRTPGEND